MFINAMKIILSSFFCFFFCFGNGKYEGTGSCQLTVLKMSANICQIRLDLEHFSVSGPEPLNHVCNTDQFLVSGGSPVPILCGNAHGEHSNYIQIF